MSAEPFDNNVETVQRRHHGARPHRETADSEARPVVHPEHGIHRKQLEQAIVHHDLGAARSLLGRLEYEPDRAGELLGLGEIARGASNIVV